MNGNERSVQKMNRNARNVLNENERDAQPWLFNSNLHKLFIVIYISVINSYSSDIFILVNSQLFGSIYTRYSRNYSAPLVV